ncbi:hypothetical protein Cpir12675_003212 [Ceratocystis pirilliformis]|uniref:Zn(2)-C6 fungal-type domain-containing protein n=1 Tax=Ceratocystis pirilliformis TaxID=259994 RepID=A0ABR3Z4G9_9PEZI
MRTSKPKVKTGCSNCKQRRIKCDERRPSCFNCEKSRRQCAGYPAPSRSARGHEIVSIAPKPRLIASAPITPITTTSRAFSFPSRVSRSYFKIPSPSLSPSPSRHSYKLQRRIFPGSSMPSPTISTPLYYAVPQPLQLLDEEVPYYQLFRSKTADELSGYFDCVFWTQTVLRECHTSNAIKYSVIALGALYKTLEQSSESPPSSPIGSPSAEPHQDLRQHWTVAVNHYAKALGAIVHEMVDTQATKRLQLMTIVLLACFDSFIGDHRQAIIQIQTGLGLLDKLRKEQRRAFISHDESEPVEEELLQMFTRLAIQAKSYDMAFHFPDPYVVRLNQKPLDDIGSPQSDSETASNFNSFRHINLPQRFTCLIEARIVWDKMLETIFRFTETFFTLQRTNNNAPMGLLPARMLQYGMGFKDQLESWGIAYQHILMSRFALGISYQEKAGISVLKMTHLMTTLLFLMTFNKEETAFDQFENYFDAIVNLAAEVVGDEERRATTQRCSNPNTCPHRQLGVNDSYTAYHIKPSFSADLGIVPPLYVVATKCRNPVIRRRAIRLLQSSSRREGMWDSQLSARIGEYIAMLEEGDGLGPRVWDLEEAPPVIPVPPSPSPVPTVTMPIVPPPNITPSTPLIKSPSSMGSASPSTSSVSSPGDDGSPRMYSTIPGARYTQTASTPMFPADLGMSLYGSESVPGGAAPPFLPHVLPLAVPMLKPIPESKRLMVQAVEFDLRARFATLRLGTRGLIPGSVDTKSRYWEISW